MKKLKLTGAKNLVILSGVKFSSLDQEGKLIQYNVSDSDATKLLVMTTERDIPYFSLLSEDVDGTIIVLDDSKPAKPVKKSPVKKEVEITEVEITEVEEVEKVEVPAKKKTVRKIGGRKAAETKVSV